jgi:transcriptional regulator of arginine metabolism
MLNAKRRRQEAILRVIARRPIATQEELVAALRRAGFDATQATVSRDILELGLVKVRNGDRQHRYAAAPESFAGRGPDRLRRFCEDYPVEGRLAQGLVVLRSMPGTANALAAALDACSFEEVVGTLAGDDTVFVATAANRSARDVLRRLEEFGVRGRL